ncbi:Fe-S protein assembly co-chaperone HscB [Pusillimonas minor]|uniref:Co-chaperone protein HscB homolog n=1 Tax=Pusillimonas minor TaxID=2697024 RepID=A0A842HS47_9BURK|nr:Fe-S protein assembly co-chaperone HscB [Pusillimonas minor]
MVENYFKLFELPQGFAIDAGALETRWRQMAARVHPDRFATAAPAERRVAMQWASTINEGHRILKSPLLRARYLCEQAGCDLQTESNTRMDGAFLMRQMEWREALDEARDSEDPARFEQLGNDIAQARTELETTVEALIDGQHDFPAAAEKVREWMFIEKLAAEVQQARHALADRQH